MEVQETLQVEVALEDGEHLLELRQVVIQQVLHLWLVVSRHYQSV